MTIDVEYTLIHCYGDQDGGMSLEVKGGTPGYDFQWTSGERNSAITGIGEGEYKVKITDAHNCMIEDSFYLEEPPELELNLEEKMDLLCRSEEHTSELQSRGHLVCRLLLEKKKKKRR